MRITRRQAAVGLITAFALAAGAAPARAQQ